MDPSSGQSQQMSSQSSLENMLVCSTDQEKKPKPQPEQAQKCPRCDSTNTKFCYYNNYSLSQPRYFCKSCRRYWTKGGTLRNVPVGGGCRKNKRSSSSSSSSSKRIQDQSFSPNLNPFNSLPLSSYEHPSDLTLALARLQKQTCGGGQLGYDGGHDFSVLGNPTNSFGDFLGNSSMNFLGNGTTTQYNNSNNVVQNMYGMYNGNGETSEVNSSCGVQMMFPYEQEMSNAVTNNTTAMRYELREQSESKVLGGFPWQQLNGGTNMGEVDSGRANWNGNFTSSNWHGLLNSPLI